jgi:multimeric flavodoxin WrbA
MRPAVEASDSVLREMGHQVETVRLKDKRIAQCRGCFGCWVRTPGQCIIDDDANEIMRSFVSSHVIVLLTPVTFGGHSSQLKKALDRMLGSALPYLERCGRDTRHPRRYDIAQRMVFVGLLPERDHEAQVTYRELSKMNALNFRATGWAMALVFSNERTEMASIAVREDLLQAGVAP